MNYNLYCTNCRTYTLHSVLDDNNGEIQTIKCLTCGFEHKHVILSSRVSVSKVIYDQYQEYEKNAE